MPRLIASLLGLSALCAAMLLVACGGDDDSSSSTETIAGVSGASCGKVVYDGDGSPQALIVSDLPLQGDSAQRSSQMNVAIRQVLDDADWKAGDLKVAFQACDDSIAKTGLWDEARCKKNANAYAKQTDVIGVIGTYNSGCAEAMIPILNQAPGGGVPMISPGNTAICLTEKADTCVKGEPDSLYPSGSRTYARVVPNDAFQGAGLATFAKQKGMDRVSVLYAADDPTSEGQATTFLNAAKAAGITVTRPQPWDPKGKSFTELMDEVKTQSPDAVLLAGLTEQGGAQLIKDKVAAMGPNDGKVGLLAPDGFAQQSTIDEAGSASKGMYASVPGKVPELLGGAGKDLVDEIADETKGEPVELYAPYAGQAVDILLSAIEKAGDDRGAVAEAVLGTKVTDGITGTFDITPSGDPSVGPVTVSVARDSFDPVKVIQPAANLVTAARGS